MPKQFYFRIESVFYALDNFTKTFLNQFTCILIECSYRAFQIGTIRDYIPSVTTVYLRNGYDSIFIRGYIAADNRLYYID